MPNYAELRRDPARKHKDEGEHHAECFEAIPGRPIREPLTKVGRSHFWLQLKALHRSTGFAHALDHLLFGEPCIVEGDGHHTTDEGRPGPPNAFDPLGLALKLLFSRP